MLKPFRLISYVSSFADKESPLYEISARDISSKMQFEIILTMEGITPETGNTIQVVLVAVVVIVHENIDIPSIIRVRLGRRTYPTKSYGVTVSSTPVLPTTKRPPSMLSPLTTSTESLQTTSHQGKPSCILNKVRGWGVVG